MFIDKNARRINVYAPFVDGEGTQYANLLDPSVRERFGITEIPDPQPPADFSDETCFRNEIDDAPYIVFTRKPQNVIDAAFNNRTLAQIAALESTQLLPRVSREFMLVFYLNTAMSKGVAEAQLTDPASPAYSPAYAKLKAFDAEIDALRNQLRKDASGNIIGQVQS